jgi:hypothetical protein
VNNAIDKSRAFGQQAAEAASNSNDTKRQQPQTSSNLDPTIPAPEEITRTALHRACNDLALTSVPILFATERFGATPATEIVQCDRKSELLGKLYFNLMACMPKAKSQQAIMTKAKAESSIIRQRPIHLG